MPNFGVSFSHTRESAISFETNRSSLYVWFAGCWLISMSFDRHNKQVFQSFIKIKDPRIEFGNCVNSVIFIAHSALVFLYDYQHIVKALAREYL